MTGDASESKGNRNAKAAGQAARQRKTRRSLEAEKRAEIAEVRGDVPQFDPAAVCEELEIFWQNGSDRYFVRGPGRDWLELSGSQLKMRLAADGYWTTPMAAKKEPGLAPVDYMVSQVDQVMLWARERRTVDYAMDVAGFVDGLHSMGPTRVLVRRGPKLIEPKEGNWDTIGQLLEGMLVGMSDLDAPGDVERVVGVNDQGFFDQRPYFLAWLRVAYQALMAGQRRPGQALVLAGPAGCGKGRLQHFLVTPILGGRSADPGGFMFGRTDFNSELFGSEHLMMEDPATSDKRDDRMFFGEMIKQFAVNDVHRFHPKGKEAVTLSPFWRLSISLNDDPDKIIVLPPLTPDIMDKLIILKCYKASMPMPTGTLAERRAFAEQVASELPAFLHFVLTAPGLEMGTEAERQRFGCASYVHPDIARLLFDQSPASQLMQIFDQAKPWREDVRGGNGEVWEGTANDLEALICDPDMPLKSAALAFQARKLCKKVQLNRLLARLEQDRPLRIGRHRTNMGRLWLVMAPHLGAAKSAEVATPYDGQ
jgi:hypothetical protein